MYCTVAKQKTLGEPLHIAKLDVNKTFDKADLNLVEEAGRHVTIAGRPKALVQGHRGGQLMLNFPGTCTSVPVIQATRSRPRIHNKSNSVIDTDLTKCQALSGPRETNHILQVPTMSPSSKAHVAGTTASVHCTTAKKLHNRVDPPLKQSQSGASTAMKKAASIAQQRTTSLAIGHGSSGHDEANVRGDANHVATVSRSGYE